MWAWCEVFFVRIVSEIFEAEPRALTSKELPWRGVRWWELLPSLLPDAVVVCVFLLCARWEVRGGFAEFSHPVGKPVGRLRESFNSSTLGWRAIADGPFFILLGMARRGHAKTRYLSHSRVRVVSAPCDEGQG